MSEIRDAEAAPPVAAAAPAWPLRWWDLGVALALVVLSAIALVSAQTGTSPRWAGAVIPGWSGTAARTVLLLTPLVAFLVLYLGSGRRALKRAMRDEPTGRSGAVFLVLLLPTIMLAGFVEPTFALLQALVYPLAWCCALHYRDAVLWSAAIAGTLGIGMYLGLALGGSDGAWFSAVFSASLSFAFAVVMGTWISRIHDEGERHRALAERLRASQAEVAALSQAAGAASERERLSRELHDTLTQTLTGLVMLSEQAERAFDAGDEARAKDRLSRVSAAAREAVAEARALVATTQPLGDGGLEAALQRVAASLQADAGIEVRCEIEAPPLDREREVVLLRAAQEGLANARKHSRARKVHLRLTGLPGGGALLALEDDGVGPGGAGPAAPGRGDADAPVPGSGGFGLSGLAERVRAVGGAVRFGPGTSGGARLEVELPAAVPPVAGAAASSEPSVLAGGVL